MFHRLRPHRIARHILDIDSHALRQQGIRGVILDLDNTLTAWRSPTVTPEVTAWVRQVQALGMRPCIVSNAFSAHRVRVVAEQLGIPWITRAAKPLSRGFIRGMALIGATPDTTVMIGDQLFTDIWGGNRLGLYTVLVEPISLREAWTTKLLQRPLERVIGRIPRNPAPFAPARHNTDPVVDP